MDERPVAQKSDITEEEDEEKIVAEVRRKEELSTDVENEWGNGDEE